MTQTPRTGSLEQVLRALKALALSPAFTLEMQTVGDQMGTGAFSPANLVDAAGNPFSLLLDDVEFGDPSGWLPNAFVEVTFSKALLPVPPFPRLQLFGMPGRVQQAGEYDTELVVGWTYLVDAIAVSCDDQADPALRSALALMDGFERLVRRNAPSLGGLVELITAEGPPAPGGPVDTEQSGNIAGVMQRFRVYTLRSLI